jgi:AraC-like DNA-binding protein
MGSRGLPSAESVVARLLAMPPPLIPLDLATGTKVSTRYVNPPFEGDLPGFKEHVLVAHVGGHSQAVTRTDGKRLVAPLVPGTVTICPSDRDARRTSSSSIEVVNVFLGSKSLQACSDQVAGAREPELLDRLGFADPKLFALVTLLGEEVASNESIARLCTEHLIDLVCLQLLRAHASSTPTAARGGRGLAPWQVKRVTAYMRDHLEQDIGLQDLSDLVRLSRFHFCGAFRMATGHTPYEWLTGLRMELARKLLADKMMRITDIALAVGYQTPSAFAASFRRHVGVPPTEFRRKL